MIQELTQALVDGMLSELELTEMTDSEMELWALHYDIYNTLRNDPSKYEELKSKSKGKRLEAVEYFWNFLEKGTLNEENLYYFEGKFKKRTKLYEHLYYHINEIKLNVDNAVDIEGDIFGGKFKVGDITYEYFIKNFPNPYEDLGSFYNISFNPIDGSKNIPQGGKENFTKILSTMYKVILDFIQTKQPDYVGIASLDNSKNKNYHSVYANLVKTNPIPGYMRKDVSFKFDSPQGKGQFVVLKRKKSQTDIDEVTPNILSENATYSQDIDYKKEIKALTKHMLMQGKKIAPLPKVIFRNGDKENAKEFLGNTAYYDPNQKIIVLYTEGRHPKDIVRSFAHEMIHHIQNLEGRLEGINSTNTNEDDGLQGLEKEAYLDGNITFRNWTDSITDPTEIILEIGEASTEPYEYKKTKDLYYVTWYEFTTDQNTKYEAYINYEGEIGEFSFKADGGGFKDLTNKGELFRVMATLTQIFLEVIKDKPEITTWVMFPSKSNDDDFRRLKLYKAYVEKQLPEGYGIEITNKGNEILINKKEEEFDLNKYKEVFNESLDFTQALSKTEKEAEKITDKTWDKFTPQECNKGFCDIFAQHLHKELPGSKIWSTEAPSSTLGHVWVEYKGKFYDAEVPKGVSDWRDLPWMKEFYINNKIYPSDIEILNEVSSIDTDLYTIYLDMDGVIADFDKQFEKYAGMTPVEYEEAFGTDMFWDLIDVKVGEKFWTGMDWMPGGKEIYKKVAQYPHFLLSSPSRGKTSRSGKQKWVEQHIPQSDLILAHSNNKKNYADEFNILIDDREKNVNQWIEAGGIGILYSTPEQVIKDLNKLGL